MRYVSTMPRPRKTAAELRLAGTLRPDRHALRDRAPPGGAAIDHGTAPPAHLAPHVATVWRELVAKLPAGLVREADAVLLESLAEAVSLHRQCARSVAVEGPFCAGSEGQPVQHPASKTLISLAPSIARLCAELGLTPQARLRLADAMPPKDAAEPDDPWAAFAIARDPSFAAGLKATRGKPDA